MVKYQWLIIKVASKKNRRRELLSVEVQAQQEKMIAEHGEEYFRKQTEVNFF